MMLNPGYLVLLNSTERIAVTSLKLVVLHLRNHLKKNYGVRYSVLMALPYFDPLRFTPIDPMHNLYT